MIGLKRDKIASILERREGNAMLLGITKHAGAGASQLPRELFSRFAIGFGLTESLFGDWLRRGHTTLYTVSDLTPKRFRVSHGLVVTYSFDESPVKPTFAIVDGCIV